MGGEMQGLYAIRLVQQIDGDGEKWTASHPDLLGCHGVGRDPKEALDQLNEARSEWISRAKAKGRRVPDPVRDLYYEIILSPDHRPGDDQAARTAIEQSGQSTEVIFL